MSHAHFVNRAKRAIGTLQRWATEGRWSPLLVRIGIVFVGLTILALIGRAALASRAESQVASMPLGDLVPSTSMPRDGGDALGSGVDADIERDASPASTEVAPSDRIGAPIDGKERRENGPIDLNRAGIDELRRLPGIGEKKARAILSLREKSGRIRRVEELLRIRGIGRKAIARLKPLVTVGIADAGVGDASHDSR